MANLLDSLFTTTFSSSSPILRRPRHHSPPRLALASSKHTHSVKNLTTISRLQFRSNHFSLSVKPKAARRRNTVVCEAAETSVIGSVRPGSDSTWESQVLKADFPVLVEFWAPWCGPCRMLHLVVAELSKQYAGRVNCFQLNTDDHPSIATQYGIRSVPTITIFVNGEKKDGIVGAVPKATIAASLDRYL